MDKVHWLHACVDQLLEPLYMSSCDQVVDSDETGFVGTDETW